MELDWQWLLVVPAVAFALGWIASRLDLRQWRRADREAPRAYFQGLNLLLNEQTDKAIDAFIEAIQHDPDTSELHFALGNLFRRRGEFERAVRVHQHLLQRGDLSASDRQRAQYALAQDFTRAGLFDRAEEAYRSLLGTRFETEAQLALLGLYERSRDWRAAVETATLLERGGTGSFAGVIAHHHCELAAEAEARGDVESAAASLAAAQASAPQAARPLLQKAQWLARRGLHLQALEVGNELSQRSPEAFARIAGEYAAWGQAAGQVDAASRTLALLYEQMPGLDLLRALATLEGIPPGRSPRLPDLLRRQPTLSAALEMLEVPVEEWPEAVRDSARLGVHEAVAHAARPLQRYRCAACGFEAQRYFWQCPGCLSWDSFPPQQVELL